MGSITWVDWSIWIVYFSLILIVLWVYRVSKKDNLYDFYIYGLLAKIFGGVAFALIYVEYYGFGDTFLYFRGASLLSETLIESPIDYFRLLASDHGSLPLDLGYYARSIPYSNTYEEWAMVKLLSPLTLLSFNSYLVTTLFMSLISFVGGWKLFRVFVDVLPAYKKWCFAAAFLTPSVIFWGGGIMKDTITLFALNFLIYFLYFGLFKGKVKGLYVLGALICGYVIVILKAYIIIAFLPGLFVTFYAFYRVRIQNVVIRYVLAPILVIPLVILSFVGLQGITSASAKYRAENIEWQVKGFHSWHTDVGGSTYNLGDIEYTALGVAQKIPQALNVTFFRPYIWEARSLVVAIGAIESLLFLALFVYVLFKHKLRFVLILRRNPLLYGLFFFCLIFGFAVGFTSFNFGALGRYKIPILGITSFLFIYLIKTDDHSELESFHMP